MSNSNPPAPAPRWLAWCGWLALAGYAGVIAFYFSPVAAGADSSGYLNSARLFAAGQLETKLRIPPEIQPVPSDFLPQFTPLGMWPSFARDALHPTYPTGLPLHLAAAGKLFGWVAGAISVGLFAALGAIWLCYATARELGLDARLAAAGAAVLALCPVFFFTSLQILSDTLATTWCLAAVYAALRARRAAGWAVACGVALAIAVLVRPTNLVLAPALVVLLGFDWRKLVGFALGGVPGAVWLALYNRALYGGVTESGYGQIGEAFALSYGLPTAWHFLKWLALLLPSVLLALPFAALTRRELRTRELLGLALWFGAIVGVYLFYEVSHQVWWCLRFILPALPPLILGGLLGIEALARKGEQRAATRLRGFAALALTAWVAVLAVYWTRTFFLLDTKAGERTYADACATVQKLFPPNTLVATMSLSGTIFFYTDFPMVRWDQVDPPRFAQIAAAAQKAGRQICAVDFKWEADRLQREHCPGNWELVTTVNNASIWRLHYPAPAKIP